MAEFDEALSKGADEAERLKKQLAESEKSAEKITSMFSGGTSGAAKESNRSSGYNYQSTGSSTSATGGNPYASMGSAAAQQYTGMGYVKPPYIRSEKGLSIFTGIAGGIGDGLLGAAGATAMALPDPNEALYTALLGERLRFYGARNVEGQPLRGLYGGRGAFRLQQQFSEVGTPTSSLDAVYAANAAAGVGLLPGLGNFSQGLKGFGGVLGGAALASNLTPGLGLVGGIQTMGALNQARRVNMLRMIGVSIRNIGGTQMKDLPEIIEQLYNILRHANGGVNPTTEQIAISAQSGNALDSLLNQFFGDDANLRQVVLSGLMQMVNTKGQSLSKSGRPAAMQRTGGSISAVRSIAATDTQELRMIQAFTGPVLSGVQVANQFLRGFYELMASSQTKGDGNGLKDTLGMGIGNLAGLLAMTETIGGARKGAGQLFVSGLLKGMLGLGGDMSGLSKLIVPLLALGGAAFGGGLLNNATEEMPKLNKFDWNNDWLKSFKPGGTAYMPNPGANSSSTPMMAPSAYSSVKSGSITINAYANTSTDPVVMGAALAKELSNQSAMTGAMF